MFLEILTKDSNTQTDVAELCFQSLCWERQLTADGEEGGAAVEGIKAAAEDAWVRAWELLQWQQ